MRDHIDARQQILLMKLKMESLTEDDLIDSFDKLRDALRDQEKEFLKIISQTR